MGANISHHKRHQEKVISSKKSSELNQHRVIEVAGQKYMACEQRISCTNESKLDHNLKRSTEIVANKTPPENNKAEGIFFDKQEEENNRDIKKANNNPTSLVITICMLKMENSEKMIVEQSASNCSVVPRTTPKCRCYETSTDGASSTNSTLNNLNKSNRNSHLNIICDNNNGNSLINNDKSEENENLLNNNSESDHILNFNLDNKFDNLTLNSNEVNDNNNSDEIYNQINDCPVLQLSGGSIISMDMDGFKIPGFNDEKILNTSILSGTSSNCCHQSSLASASSCCRKKSSSSSSKNSNRKSCKCGSPSSSSKESSSSSNKSKKGNWAGLKFNCAKLKNNNVKPNNSFPSTSTTSFPIMETRRTPEESCICTSYRKVDDFHLNSSPISHHELALLNAQRHIIHRTVRPSGDFLLFLNHGAPMLNISRFNEEFTSDDERVRGMETGQHSSTVSHPQSLFFCTHSPCPSSPEPSLLHKRLLDNELNPNANDIPHTRIHSQVDFEHFLVPDLQKILACSYYWAKIDRYEAEKLLDGKPEGTFLLRDSAQEEFLFSVSFRKYNRSLHARIEQFNHKFSFDSRDPGVYTASTVTGLLEHYKDPTFVMFFEPMLTQPLNRNFCFSLQQLCRASIVSHTTYDGVDQLCLPKSLKTYLKEYHYRQRVRVRPVEHLYTSIM